MSEQGKCIHWFSPTGEAQSLSPSLPRVGVEVTPQGLPLSLYLCLWGGSGLKRTEEQRLPANTAYDTAV